MQFLKYVKLYIAISALVILPGLYSLVVYGLNPSIDFTGGSLLEVSVQNGETKTIDQVKTAIGDAYEISSIQSSGPNQYLIKGTAISNDQKNQVMSRLIDQLQSPVEELRFETIGPTLSKELLIKTLYAIVLVSLIITSYVAYQFKELRYGLAAVLAMFHDSLVLLGLFSIFGHFLSVEVDELFVTALLTTLSFSVHDTIVVFHRIRELRARNPRAEYTAILDTAITETLNRSINNSMTIIIMLVALSLLGGATIRWFSIALLIGAITGTYSSPFVAVPLLMIFEFFEKSKKKVKLK